MAHTASRSTRFSLLTAAILALIALALPNEARAVSLQELVRLKGQGKSELRGFGLVMGLPGTGDSGADLVVARPLAQLLQNEGNPIADLEELAKSKSVALVMVTCTVPETGARADDQIDCYVSAVHNPKSLEGGTLFIAPLRGPLPGQGVFAMASGPLVMEGLNTRSGRVRGGAKMVKDVPMPTIAADGSITLIVDHSVANWTTSQLIASTINQHRLAYDDRAPDIARAFDERTIRVAIPQEELANPANFLADVMSIRFDPSLIDLPARIVVNEREGAIVATGDVEISPTLITHGDLVITTMNPEPVATPQNPLLEASRWTVVATATRASEGARLQDLLSAFRQLDVSVDDQIAILNLMRRSGKLHAEMIVD